MTLLDLYCVCWRKPGASRLWR